MENFLKEKARWVWEKTLEIHKTAHGTRLASSLSCVEILTALYYGGIIEYDPTNEYNEGRDRFIISKAHGSISFYPILADLGFFPLEEIYNVGKAGHLLPDIPDCAVPGYETVNGSLGHGLGIACGMATALRRRGKPQEVFVLSGDGELNEGSVWEAVMFAGHHRLDNITLLIDNNKLCMLDYCKNVLDIGSLEEKLGVFGWEVHRVVDGHDVVALWQVLQGLKGKRAHKPKALIADTIKGKGVPALEGDRLCHIRSLSAETIDSLLKG